MGPAWSKARFLGWNVLLVLIFPPNRNIYCHAIKIFSMVYWNDAFILVYENFNLFDFLNIVTWFRIQKV